MDKSATDQSKEEGQTSKPSVASSTVLNILKRFRSRRESSEDQEPSFDDRLGAASGPLAQRISEISTLIEAGRAGAAEESGSQPSDGGKDTGETVQEDMATAGHSADANSDGEADARPSPRQRSMGFHNPVFPASPPEAPKDPDFKASTNPPALKIHDAPAGVMENSGAPEKRITAPKDKAAEPLDLKVFAKQVRSTLNIPEEKSPPAGQSPGESAETAVDAAAFKQQFYSRISKASRASAFEPAAAADGSNLLNLPKSAMNLDARNVTASSALQSWRKFHSPAVRKPDGVEADHPTAALHAVDTEPPPLPVDPAPLQADAPFAAEVPQATETAAPDAPDHAAEQDGQPTDHASLEPGLAEAGTEMAADGPAESFQVSAPEPDAEWEPEPMAEQMEDPEPEMLSDFEPADSIPAEDPQSGQDREPEGAVRTDPDNVFAALDIDEDDLLIKVYDVIQSELQAAWGENITLNIRRIVRQEVRAALEKARSGP